MPSTTDYYALLHVQPDAPDAVIKASYRTLMQKLKMHPDLGGDVGIASEINQAYATLSDPSSRAEYDKVYVELRKLNATETAQAEEHNAGRSTGTAQQTGYSRHSSHPQNERVMWCGDVSRLEIECNFCLTPHPFKANPPQQALCPTCGCPLAGAGTRTLLDGERRALDRLELERRISFRSNHRVATQPAETRDLSLTGLLFCADADLVHDQLVQIESVFCLALARVAHVAPAADTLFGVEFLTLSFPNVSGSLVSTTA